VVASFDRLTGILALSAASCQEGCYHDGNSPASPRHLLPSLLALPGHHNVVHTFCLGVQPLPLISTIGSHSTGQLAWDTQVRMQGDVFVAVYWLPCCCTCTCTCRIPACAPAASCAPKGSLSTPASPSSTTPRTGRPQHGLTSTHSCRCSTGTKQLRPAPHRAAAATAHCQVMVKAVTPQMMSLHRLLAGWQRTGSRGSSRCVVRGSSGRVQDVPTTPPTAGVSGRWQAKTSQAVSCSAVQPYTNRAVNWVLNAAEKLR